MLARTIEIFDFIKRNLQVANKGATKEDIVIEKEIQGKIIRYKAQDAIVEFINDVYEQLVMHPRCSLKTENKKYLKQLGECELYSVLANIYRVGRCNQHAMLGANLLLKAGIKNKIQIIRVSGKPLKEDSCSTHDFVVIGDVQPMNLEQLKDCIIFDTWGNSELKIHENNKPVFLHDLASSASLSAIHCSEVRLSFNKNLQSKDFDFLITLLTDCKTLITPELLTVAANLHDLIPVDIDHEKQRIHAGIDKQIAALRQLKNSPPIPASIVFSNPAEEKTGNTESLNVLPLNQRKKEIMPTELIISTLKDGKPIKLASFKNFNEQELYSLRSSLGKDSYTQNDVVRTYDNRLDIYVIQKVWIDRNPIMIPTLASILKISAEDFKNQTQLAPLFSSSKLSLPTTQIPAESSPRLTR